jgi:hypothetical protein
MQKLWANLSSEIKPTPNIVSKRFEEDEEITVQGKG